MKKIKTLVESYLTELMRGLHTTISPQSHMDELNYFMNKNNRDSFRQRYPHCFEALKYIDGREDNMLPICNRSGSIDPQIINLTILMIKKFKDEENENDKIDINHLDLIIDKLTKLENKHSKSVVKPMSMAYRKGRATKDMNHVKKYLEAIRNKVTKND